MHFKDKQKTEELALAFDAFCNGTGENCHRQILEKYGYSEKDSYCVTISEHEAEEYICSNENIYVKGRRIVFCNMADEEIAKVAKGIRSHTGAGSVGVGFESLYKSSERAEKALKVAVYKDNKFFAYEKSGIYSLFMEFEDTECIERFGSSFLGKVYNYDKKHGSDMMKTLMAYIKCRGSVKAAAESLSCHRNTVTYRMEKLKEMLGNDLENGEYLAELMAAGAALEYADTMKNELKG